MINAGVIAIDDPLDPRIDVFQGLRDKALRQKRESLGGDMQGVFIAEGDLVINRALTSGYVLHSVLIDAARKQPLPENFRQVDVYSAGPAVLQHIAGFHSYRGAIGCFHRREVPTMKNVIETISFRTFAIIEGVNNPNNLGTIMRYAAALDVDALLLSSSSCDPLSRRCCRVSMGEAFALPYAWFEDTVTGLKQIKAAGIKVVAMTPAENSLDLSSMKVLTPERVGIMLGAEGPGLSEDALTMADQRVVIPMSRSVDSINVGGAAAIAFFAVQQARRT